MGDNFVRLNVGGVAYTTTKATLSRYPGSVLGAMFNGSLPAIKDDSGAYFIDRDGHLFHYILIYLRSSQLVLPEGFELLDQLVVEADYYQVEPLIQALVEYKACHKQSTDLVRLNVGGVPYTTTKATLSRYPGSMLGAMFNGSLPTTKDSSGAYFIDRDGHLFEHVLNFLRSSQLALPDGFKLLDQLAVEADFYQVEPLIQALAEHKRRRQCQSQRIGCLLEVIEVRTGSTATMPTNNSRVKTIVSGRSDVISHLPAQFIGHGERLQHSNDSDFTELQMNGSNVRLELAEYLQDDGWILVDSNLSSSSGYDSKSMISSLIIEQSYRDRWLLPHPAQ